MSDESNVTLEEIFFDLRKAYHKAYSGFVDTCKRLPVNEQHFKIALQHFDTGSLWLLDGMSDLMAKNFEQLEKQRQAENNEPANEPTNDSANCT